MPLRRRHLFLAAATSLASARRLSPAKAQVPPHSQQGIVQASAAPDGNADYTIRIGNGLIELGPDTIVSTKLYSDKFPGPLLRLTEGKQAIVDIQNDTDTPEQLHWHGLFLPADVDGAAEEGTPYIPPHGTRRIAFTPRPAGFRFYHTHLAAGSDLTAGLYNGQVGLVYVEPRQDVGAYDREVFLTLKEFGPFLSRTEMPSDFLAPTRQVPELRAAAVAAAKEALSQGLPQGYELAYNFFTVNGRMLGQGEPIRVKPGERLLLHVLNASATEIRSLALPGHAFTVVALDGNLVPHPVAVPVLWIGPAERVCAIVEMKHPGVWVMGDLSDEDRDRGMGIVVEYAGQKGKPVWRKAAPFRWDYTRFGKPGATSPPPDQVVELTFAARNGALGGFDKFTINGVAFSMDNMEPLLRLRQGLRYRLHMRNATDDIHPIHLHRHSFELTSIAGVPTAGVMKDVVLLGAFQEMTIDFTANQRGLSLFHCHMQDHMDHGFMALFDCV
jgi:FtsP/CotA-like multicopper oxidase with cupredoxin domain